MENQACHGVAESYPGVPWRSGSPGSCASTSRCSGSSCAWRGRRRRARRRLPRPRPLLGPPWSSGLLQHSQDLGQAGLVDVQNFNKLPLGGARRASPYTPPGYWFFPNVRPRPPSRRWILVSTYVFQGSSCWSETRDGTNIFPSPGCESLIYLNFLSKSSLPNWRSDSAISLLLFKQLGFDWIFLVGLVTVFKTHRLALWPHECTLLAFKTTILNLSIPLYILK